MKAGFKNPQVNPQCHIDLILGTWSQNQEQYWQNHYTPAEQLQTFYNFSKYNKGKNCGEYRFKRNHEAGRGCTEVFRGFDVECICENGADNSDDEKIDDQKKRFVSGLYELDYLVGFRYQQQK